MQKALEYAKNSGKDIPVGAVIVKDDRVIAIAHNQKESDNDVTSHAEILAIRTASQFLHNWRLDGCDMYVTLEPCPMCMGAALNARIKKIYFGAYEDKGRSLTKEIAEANLLNHKIEVEGGIMQEECKKILSDFFSSMREREKRKKEN